MEGAPSTRSGAVAARREPSTALRVVGVVAVAAVLRPPIAGVGPVLGDVQRDLGLSAATVSALTALPVLCFGAGAFAGPALARRLGMDRALAAVLFALAGGLLFRVAAGPAVLVAGTAVAGGAIAVANVLLPSVVKQDFPRRVGLMTGAYTATLSGFAALAALTAVPLAGWTASGWRGSLLSWGGLAVLALLLWLPQLRSRGSRPAALAAPHLARRLLRNRQALALTLFMGLQSLCFYSVLTWLPSLLVDAGWSAAGAGALLSVATVIGIPAGLVLPPLAARSDDQRWLCVAVSAVIAAGLLGLLLMPTAATLLWVVLLGLGLGAAFPLALLLIVLRSSGPAVTGQLSAMVQGLGYLLAATGPFLVGVVYEATGSWSPSLVLLLGCVLVQAAAGWVAGRAGHAA
jgi:CP family cyanate transporter-like MFS transporter